MHQSITCRLSEAIVTILISACSCVYAHDTQLHREITNRASPLSDGLKTFVADVFPGQDPANPNIDQPLFSGAGLSNAGPRGYVVSGSEREDTETNAWGLATRCFNHFYDPISQNGLSDLKTGISSYQWASTSAGNDWRWGRARDYEYLALTNSTKASRDEMFARTFRAIGQVLHLLEDDSEPEHVRNVAHPVTNFPEVYGRDHRAELVAGAAATALAWDAAGFTRLEDFWDRGFLRASGATALNNDAANTDITKTLGLAEFTNGNFLGWNSLYGEAYSPQAATTMHWYQFPSLNGTNYSKAKNFIKEGVDPDGLARPHVYISKTGDGVQVTRHAILTYLGCKTKNVTKISKLAGISIHDDALLREYHEILVPKSISYAAGCLDYFFRGKLGLRITWDQDNSRYRLEITNASTQTFKGGEFTLYADDANGNRSAITLNLDSPWNSGSTLAAGASIQATFQAASQTAKGYMLVYKGTIGTGATGDAADPVDDGIAIAAHQFQLLRFNIGWDPKSDIDLYLVDPNGSMIWYGSKTSSLGELDIDNIGNTGPENITLKTVIDGDYQVWANYYADHYQEDPESTDPDPETPISVTMHTYYNSSTALDTNSFTLTKPNYGSDRPIGTSGPATQPSWYVLKLVTVKDGVVTAH